MSKFDNSSTSDTEINELINQITNGTLTSI
jgi:hypothetical protein